MNKIGFSKKVIIITLIITVYSVSYLFSQPLPPPPAPPVGGGTGGPGVPIEGGLTYLLAAGAAYAVNMLYKFKVKFKKF